MSKKRALILGIGGQDGSYLAEILLERGYEVHGFYRRSSVDNLIRIAHIRDQVTLHKGDLVDMPSLDRILFKVQPEEVYNEADQDHIDWSYAVPYYSEIVTCEAVKHLLYTLRESDIRLFQPLSATIFGDATPSQNEDTPLCPQSPYARAKAMAYRFCRRHRQEYGTWVSTAILYNHDSPRRQGDYLLHKIVRGALAIKAGKLDKLPIGNLDARVEIGYAPEYMEAAWKLLQLEKPTDVVLGTGVAWTIRQWIREVFFQLGIYKSAVEMTCPDPAFQRPGNPPTLCANTNKAKSLIGWKPQVGREQLVALLLQKYQTEGY